MMPFYLALPPPDSSYSNLHTLASGISYNRSSATFIFVLNCRLVQALTPPLTYHSCDRPLQNLPPSAEEKEGVADEWMNLD